MLLQMPRTQRFPDSFHQALQSLVLSIMPHITIRYTEIPEEARSINLSLANFIKVENVPLCTKMKLNLFNPNQKSDLWRQISVIN